MAKRTKKTIAHDDAVEDIVRASQLLSEGNKKLLAKIDGYEDQIDLLKEEVAALKSHTRKKRVDELSKENTQLQSLTEKLRKSESTFKELAQELQHNYAQSKEQNDILQRELNILKNQLDDKEETLHTQQKALAARKNESQVIAQVNKKLRERQTHTSKTKDSISDLVTARSIEIRRLRRLVEKYSKETHELLNKERAYKEKIISLQEQSMKERRTAIVLAQKVENLKKEVTTHATTHKEHVLKTKDFEDLIAHKEKEIQKHLINIKILTEDAAEKERVIARLNMALKTRKEEAQVIAEINTRIIEKDKELSANQRRVQELLMVKDEQSHNYKLIAEELRTKLNATRESHMQAHKEFERVVSDLQSRNERIQILEGEKRKITQSLVTATREHEKQKQEIDAFKHQIKKLFGVNKDMEHKTVRFSEYLENLRSLLYKKQALWDQKEADYKEEIEHIKQVAEEKIKTVLKEETDTVISLKSALVRLKEDLKDKEEQLIKRDIQERDMVLEITHHLRNRYEGDKVSDIPTSTQGVPDEVTQALAEKERQINQDLLELQLLKNQSEARILGELEDHILVGEQRVELQEPEIEERPQHLPPSQRRKEPRRKQHPMQRPAPISQPPIPQQERSHPHKDLQSTRKRYTPQVPSSYDLKKYYREGAGKDADTILKSLDSRGKGVKGSNVQFIEGEPKAKKGKDTYGGPKHNNEPAIDLGISYSKANPLISMVDIGLQQGEDIDTIRDSLIKTGYDKEEVESVIATFKKGKLGSL